MAAFTYEGKETNYSLKYIKFDKLIIFIKLYLQQFIYYDLFMIFNLS